MEPSTAREIRDKMKEHLSKLKHQIDADSLLKMLREKCRVRMREARQLRFDGGRPSPMEHGHNPLDGQYFNEAMMAELRSLNVYLDEEHDLMEEFFSVSVDTAIEYIKVEMQGSPKPIDLSIYVICPVCLMGELGRESNTVMGCRCGLQFAYEGDLLTLRQMIDLPAANHKERCPSTLIYYGIPLNTGLQVLCASCQSCDFHYQIGLGQP